MSDSQSYWVEFHGMISQIYAETFLKFDNFNSK